MWVRIRWEDGGTQIVSGASGNVQGAYVVVGPDHAVYVFYFDNTTATESIKVVKSTDRGATFGTAVTVGVYVAAALIVLYELLIGYWSEASGRELIGHTVVGVILGLLIITVRVLLH